MTGNTSPGAAVPVDRDVAIHNRLSQGHRLRLPLEEALRSCLRELSGRWDISVHEIGRILVQLDVVAPDGSRWSLAVPVHEGPPATEVAEAIRAGCARLSARQDSGGNQA